MKKLILGLSLLSLFIFPILSNAKEAFVIENFQSTLAIQPDGTLSVTEDIQVTFSAERHGIFRDLPFVYEASNGTKTYTNISVTKITDGLNNVPFEITKNSSNLRIRIGDAKKLVFGPQRYVINYTATGVLLPYESYDELYWNVTGNEWLTEIKNSSALVTLPSEKIIQSDCFIGRLGSKERCKVGRSANKQATFSSGRILRASEGLTIAIGFEKGVVPLPIVSAPPTVLGIITNLKTLSTFLATALIGLFIIFRMWWTKGRDKYYKRKSLHDEDAREESMSPGTHESIGAEYEPPDDLRPAEIGVLMDERADTLDVSATIVDLAVRGYLTIKEIPKKWFFGSIDYELTQTKKEQGELMKYETTLLANLFEDGNIVKLSDLKKSFYKHLKKVKKELYKEVVRKLLFAKNPERIRNIHMGWAVGITILGGLLSYFSLWLSSDGTTTFTFFALGLGGGLILDGIVYMFMSSFMPRRTAGGREAYRLARGYRLFVSGTEKYRQPFFEDQNIFMQVLPYAMVFSVTKKLANAMKDMGIEPPAPTWYVGAHPFNMTDFTSSMDSFSNSLSTAIASTPSGSGSGGGGFSGGGVGGGGGGSW